MQENIRPHLLIQGLKQIPHIDRVIDSINAGTCLLNGELSANGKT